MSREGAKAKQSTAPTGGTPIWVWLVYGLGILAATVLVGTGLFAVGALIASNDSFGLDWNVSVLAILLWGGLIVLAAVTWLWRRGGGR